MKVEEIKTPEDVFNFMNENITYGWIDVYGIVHQNEMKNFRTTYRIVSLEQCLQFGVGTCIEQVYLMHKLFCKIDIPNKMYCWYLRTG